MKTKDYLSNFIGAAQLAAINQGCSGEEREYFLDKVIDMTDLIQNMPKTYDQDGKGDAAIVYLHYFNSGCDWYIIEKDMEEEDQQQAFGLADLGYGGELGYISIKELINGGAELDLHFTTRPLSEIRK